MTLNDFIKLCLVVLIVVGTIYWQTTTGNVPTWLAISFCSVVSYYLGFTSNTGQKG